MTRRRLRKADLHVHTIFSKYRHLKILHARDSYSDPLRVYERCRRIGLDYVVITDHDTIDGACDLLSRRPDLEPTVIVGEEVETYFPDTGQWAHVNVLGVDAAIHEEIQRAKENIHDLVRYLRSKGLFHVLNHPLQSYRLRQQPLGFFEEALALFTHVEIANGTLSPSQNRAAAAMLDHARRLGLARFGVGGSDAHGLGPIGSYVTVAAGENRDEWLASLVRGDCLVAGREIGFLRMVGEVYSLIGKYYGRLGSHDARRCMGPASYAAAAGLLPVCVGGIPFFLFALNYLGKSGLGEIVRRSLARERSEGRTPVWAPVDLAGDSEG